MKVPLLRTKGYPSFPLNGEFLDGLLPGAALAGKMVRKNVMTPILHNPYCVCCEQAMDYRVDDTQQSSGPLYK